MPRGRPQYPPQFNSLEAVDGGRRTAPLFGQIHLVDRPGEIGVSRSHLFYLTSLRNWVKQARIDEGQREGLITQEREELKRPRGCAGR